MNAPSLLRPVRAAVFAAVTVGLSVLGHGLAAHAVVPAGMVGLGFAVVAVAAAALGGRERSYGSILAGMCAGQVGLHLLFSTVAPAEHAPGHPFVGISVPEHVHVLPGGGGLGMVIAHAWAALIAAWWLRRGEATAWMLIRRFVTAVCAPLGLTGAPPRPGEPLVAGIVIGGSPPTPVATLALRHVVVRRGPPLAAHRPYPHR